MPLNGTLKNGYSDVWLAQTVVCDSLSQGIEFEALGCRDY